VHRMSCASGAHGGHAVQSEAMTPELEPLLHCTYMHTGAQYPCADVIRVGPPPVDLKSNGAAGRWGFTLDCQRVFDTHAQFKFCTA
jgi:hypothetical protein